MKRFLVILAFLGCLLAPEWANAHLLGPYQSVGRCTGAIIDDLTGDTIYLATIRDFYVFPKRKFRNKRQERFYWKTVRDVKKTLPYAKEIAKEIEKEAEEAEEVAAEAEAVEEAGFKKTAEPNGDSCSDLKRPTTQRKPGCFSRST